MLRHGRPHDARMAADHDESPTALPRWVWLCIMAATLGWLAWGAL